MEEIKDERENQEEKKPDNKPDELQQAALNYEKLLNTEYVYTLGTRTRKKVIIEFIGCNSEEFTHIYGLEHLTDIKDFADLEKKSAAKKKIYGKIKNGEYPLNDLLKNSIILSSPRPQTYNPDTKKEFTIYDRILALKDLESVLDNVENAALYRWDKNKCKIICPNGKGRHTNINADSLLVIPSRKGVNYYLFAYKQKNVNPKEPMRLKIHSAFIDGVDLTMGQGKPFAILQVDKVTTKKKEDKTKEKTIKTLYIRPGYEPNTEISA